MLVDLIISNYAFLLFLNVDYHHFFEVCPCKFDNAIHVNVPLACEKTWTMLKPILLVSRENHIYNSFYYIDGLSVVAF